MASNLGTDKLVKFLGLNWVQMIEKFRGCEVIAFLGPSSDGDSHNVA